MNSRINARGTIGIMWDVSIGGGGGESIKRMEPVLREFGGIFVSGTKAVAMASAIYQEYSMEDGAGKSGCFGMVMRMLGFVPAAGPAPSVPTSFPYGLRDAFLSPAEISFFHVVKGVIPEGQYVIAKVNLADLFFVAQPHINQAARNRIDRKHVDFAICEAGTMRPLLGIELDDASHQRAKAKESDEFKNRVFAAAGLPLLRVPARHAYEPAAIAAMIREKTGGDFLQGQRPEM